MSQTIDPKIIPPKGDPNNDNPPPTVGDAHVQPESLCNKLRDILAVVMSKEEGLQASVFELMQRKKINAHVTECKHPKCNELKVDRINTGLY